MEKTPFRSVCGKAGAGRAAASSAVLTVAMRAQRRSPESFTWRSFLERKSTTRPANDDARQEVAFAKSDSRSMPAFGASDGAELVYEERSAGLPALVFIHGWQADRSVWRDVIDALGPGVRTIAVDLRGGG